MVSYCQSSGTLTVTLTSPDDQSTSPTLSNVFTYIPFITGSDDYLVNATLYIDGVATAVTNSTAITNGAANTLSYLFSSIGTYTWNVQVFNSTDYAFASNYFTLTVFVPTPTPTPTPAPTRDANCGTDLHAKTNSLSYSYTYADSNPAKDCKPERF